MEVDGEEQASLLRTWAPCLVEGSQAVDLRGLSVKQPWLHRIMHEGKDVENRTRRIFTSKREAVGPRQDPQPQFQPHMKP